MSKQIHEQLTQLQQLEVELHKANQELAEASQPIERLSEMNDEQRRQLADQIRAKLARWEAVTQQISQVLGTGGNGIK
jgi:flagellar biosynthesis chaperone FliJ